MTQPVKMSEHDYRVGAHDYWGLCLNCGEIVEGGVEPDAENYPCEGCSADRVWGFEQCLIAGYIEFDGDRWV